MSDTFFAPASVFKHIHSFYYPERPAVGYYRDPKTQKEIDIVKYREDAAIRPDETIVDLARDKETRAIIVTKRSSDFGVLEYDTHFPMVKIPAFAFLYLLGHAERKAVTGIVKPPQDSRKILGGKSYSLKHRVKDRAE